MNQAVKDIASTIDRKGNEDEDKSAFEVFIIVQTGMSLSEGERIRKLEKEIKEVQNLKTIMFNQLEMKTRKWAEVDKVKQRFEDMFAGFENKLANIEAKMEEVREKSKASERIEKKPRESGKSKVSGRIEKKSKEKPNKTQK